MTWGPARPLRILDTTLRDGDQSACGSFSFDDKVRIARLLDEAGVDVVEAGFPASSRAEAKACEAIAGECSRATVSVMCRTIPSEIRLAASTLARARRGMLHLTLPVSDLHMRARLGSDRAEVLNRVRVALEVAREYAFEIELGAEDATRADPAFLLEYCELACDLGVGVINLADTVGYAAPEETARLVAKLVSEIPAIRDGATLLGIHAHDDMGLALANTLAAVRAGCAQAEVTVGGVGERSGNAALEELVANLLARPDLYGATTSVRPESLVPLVDTVSLALAVAPSPFKPVVGTNARAHASGMHQQGLSRDADTYSPRSRSSFSSRHRIALSAHSGTRGVIDFAREIAGIELAESLAGAALLRVKRRGASCGITEFLASLRAGGEIESPVWMPERISAVTEVDGNGVARHALSATVSLFDGASAGARVTETKRAEAASGSLVDAARDLVRALFDMDLSVRVFSVTGYGDGARVYLEAARSYAGENIAAETRGRLHATERRGSSPGVLLVVCLVDFANAELAEKWLGRDRDQ